MYTYLFINLCNLGNVLSLMVSVRPKLSNSSFAVYLGSLAVADTLVLWAQVKVKCKIILTSPISCSEEKQGGTIYGYMQ